MLVTRTRSGMMEGADKSTELWMEGADKSTELWRHPIYWVPLICPRNHVWSIYKNGIWTLSNLLEIKVPNFAYDWIQLSHLWCWMALPDTLPLFVQLSMVSAMILLLLKTSCCLCLLMSLPSITCSLYFFYLCLSYCIISASDWLTKPFPSFPNEPIFHSANLSAFLCHAFNWKKRNCW